MTKIKIGVVGCGGMGMMHVGTINSISGMVVDAVCDLDENRAKAAAKASDDAKVYSDYTKLLEHKGLDAVYVCTPNDLHAPITIAAMNEGLHVFCEKPMAFNAQQAKEMLDARNSSGKTLQIGVCQRFRGDAQAIKKYGVEGAFGDIYFAKCGYLRRSGIPGMGGWFTTRKRASAGPTVDLGVHALDLTMYLMDNFEPVSVSGCTYAKFGPLGKGGGDWGTANEGGTFDVEDLAAALIKFKNGASVFLEVSWAAHVGSGSFYSMILGDKAGAILDPPTIFTDEHGQPVDKKLNAPTVDAYVAESEHFRDSILNGAAPMPSAEEGLAVQKVLDALQESAATGKEIQIR